MSPQFTTGVTFAWILACGSLAAVFAVAYGTRRREPEHLVFAFLALTVAVHAWGVDVTLGELPDSSLWRIGTRVGYSSTIAGIALFVHYGLLFGGKHRARAVLSLYSGAAVLMAIASLAGPFATNIESSARRHLLGISVGFTRSALTPPGAVIATLAALFTILAVVLLARAYLGGRREGLAACVGGIIFAVALVHDLLVLLAIYSGPWLTPLGFLVFAFGVGCSLLIRHAVLGKELERRTLELERSYSHLRATQAELVRKQQLAAVGELAAVIAHEVRNPLAIIMNAITSLHRRDLHEADETMLLDILNEESRRLNRLVGDLLRYSRPVKVHRQEVDIRNVIGRALHALNAEGHIEVALDGQDELPSISGDPDLLRLVFGNLIDNAAQSMSGAGGKLTIRTRPQARDDVEGVAISIADNGHGMDPNVRERATDPFFTTRPSGTGLGLAIVERIVEAHAGAMTIDSQPGAGTVIHVFLPLDSLLSGSDELGNGSGPVSSPMPIMMEAR